VLKRNSCVKRKNFYPLLNNLNILLFCDTLQIVVENKNYQPISINNLENNFKDSQIENETLAALIFTPKTIRFENQNPDEKILLLVREHPAVFAWNALMTLFGVFVPFVLIWTYNFFSSKGYLAFTIDTQWWVVGIMLWYLYLLSNIFRRFISWFYNVNLMTNERFLDLDFSSFTDYRVKECSILKIQDAKDMHAGPWQMLFDMGDIVVHTASEDTRFELENVPNSSKVRDFIMDVVIKEIERHRRTEEVVNAP